MTTLARSGQPPDDDLTDLRAQLAARDAALRERSAEVAALKSSLDAFKIRYRHEVGLLHEQLDELEAAIEAAERGVRAVHSHADASDRTEAPAESRREAAPRLTSDAVRRLFRDVAKAVHPDLARDQLTRDRRHSLMIAANQAYATGDEERLRWILDAWERSPEAVVGDDADAARLRLVRRMAQIDEQLESCSSDLATLKDSPLFKLKVIVDEAAARGKDLVGDMVKRLKRDIMVARNRLEAIRGSPE